MKFSSNKEGRLSSWNIFAYGSAAFGYNAIYFWITGYLMIFCTDVVGILPAAVSSLMLFVRLFDAVNDPLIGSAIDRTKNKRGKFYPWLLYGSIGLTVTVLMLFWAPSFRSYNAKLIWVYVLYSVTIVFATMQNMAYVGLSGKISSNSLDRSKATSVRMALSSTAMLLIGFIAPLVLKKLGDNGTVANQTYLISILPFAIIGLPFMLITTFCSKEVNITQASGTPVAFRDQLKSAVKNRPILILTVGMMTYGFVMYGRLGIGAYYFTYVVGDTAYYSIYNLVNSLASIGGTFLAPVMYKKIGHKGRIEAWGLLVCAAAMALQYIFIAPSFMFFVLTAVSGMCFGLCAATQYGMIPDAIDYGEYKFHVRADGFLASFTSFGFKVGNSLGTALIGWVLAAVGYVANVGQAPRVVTSINALMTLVPTGFAIIAAALFFFYNIDREKHSSIMKELQNL